MEKMLFASVVIVCACGGGGDDGDGGGDGGGGGPSGEVHVETRDGCCLPETIPRTLAGDLVNGVLIVAIEPDGDVVRATTANGVATLVVQAGSSVSALYGRSPDAPEVVVMTYLDVQPGDTLRFGGVDGPDGSATTEMRVTFEPVSGVFAYSATGGCMTANGGASDAELDFVHLENCEPATEDILVRALMLNGSGMYGYLPDVAWQNGGAVALPAWQPIDTFTLRATELPTAFEYAQLELRLILNDAAMDYRQTQVVGRGNGTAEQAWEWAPVGDGSLATAYGLGGSTRVQISKRLPAGALGHTFTAADWPAAPANVTYAPADHALFFEAADDPAMDATVANISATRTNGTVLHSIRWQVIAPPAARTLALPDFPPDLDYLEPRATDRLDESWLTQWDLAEVEGWDAARATPINAFGGNIDYKIGLQGVRTTSSRLGVVAP